MEKNTMDTSIGKRILNFPLTKIIIGFTAIVCVFSISKSILGDLFYQTSLGEIFFYIVVNAVPLTLCIVAYIFLYKYYEKRKITEFSCRKIVQYLSLGIIIGAALQSLTILVIHISGGFNVVSVNSFKAIIPALFISLATAVLEEVLFRGILFRIMEEKLGSIISLIISALIFGFLHLMNPGSSIFSSIAIAVEAGVLLGAAYILTRNLWFPIAIHFAWNFTQSGIFGALTSGGASNRTLLVSEITGDELITGGAFGPEGSLQAVLFCLAAGVVLMYLSKKKNKIVRPFWKVNQ